MESVKEVEWYINKEKPDIVALELDKGRFKALLYGKSKVGFMDLKDVGIKGYLFGLIGAYVEKKIGKIVGVSPGSEMKKAAEVAKENKCRIALIDQDIRITLKRFSKEITWKEKFRFLFDIFKGVFKRQRIPFDLKRVPSKKIIEKLMGDVKRRYPNAYHVLVVERNKIMAKHLYSLMQNYKVVAVVGAGHEEDIVKEIRCLEEKR